jgi:hypothetical protein
LRPTIADLAGELLLETGQAHLPLSQVRLGGHDDEQAPHRRRHRGHHQQTAGRSPVPARPLDRALRP